MGIATTKTMIQATVLTSRPTSAPLRRYVGSLRSHRLKWPDLVLAGTDDPGRGLGHFVPSAREITERFGDHQPGFLAQTAQDLHLGVQLT